MSKDTSQTLDEILNMLGASNIPGTHGQFHEVDPSSIKVAKAALEQLLQAREVEARIDELLGMQTNRHYGKDQDSLDELDEYREKRIAFLEVDLSTLTNQQKGQE